MRVNPITLEAEYPEPPPGSDPRCWGPPGLTPCTEPYAATYGFGGEELRWVERIFRYYGWWPGWEDWADSFASYIYPDYFPSELGLTGLGPIRKAYIKEQISKIK